MGYARAKIFLVALLATAANAGLYYVPRYESKLYLYGGCDNFNCGINAKCTMCEGRPVCSCFNLHVGDPLSRCIPVECTIDEDCPYNKYCINNKCVNPCEGQCGINALCKVKNHIPVCSCLPGYTGDPFVCCRISDPQAACKPSPCGQNTQCKVINGIPVCSCLPGYLGSPLIGCRHECESDQECPAHLYCSTSFKCEDPCKKCDYRAYCDVINHQANCRCPKNWLGNPYVQCRPECVSDKECWPAKPVCQNHICTNPCSENNICGVNAICELRGATPVCKCPRNMTGNPFVGCTKPDPQSFCKAHTCGQNAICSPYIDSNGLPAVTCNCPKGYLGYGLTKCVRGECQIDADCPDDKACMDYTCKSPCTGKECAPTATCTGRSHIAVCTCPEGTRGDAIYSCHQIISNYNYGRAYKHG